MKACSRCSIEKHAAEFYKKKSQKDGKSVYCKKCSDILVLLWKSRNADRVKDINNKCGKKHNWYQNDKTCQKMITYRLTHPDKIKENGKRYESKNKEKREERNRYNVDNLTNCYVKSIALNKGYTKDMIRREPEILEIIKIIIKTKRLCKLKTSNN